MTINLNLVLVSLILFSCPRKENSNVDNIAYEKIYVQINGQTNKVNVNGYELTLSKTEAVETETGFCEVQNSINLKKGADNIHDFTVCSADLKDIQFVNKGYLTVVQHYSSPVGWYKYFIFDFCKNKIIETKRLDEGTEIEWASFINYNSEFKESIVEKVTKF